MQQPQSSCGRAWVGCSLVTWQILQLRMLLWSTMMMMRTSLMGWQQQQYKRLRWVIVSRLALHTAAGEWAAVGSFSCVLPLLRHYDDRQ